MKLKTKLLLVGTLVNDAPLLMGTGDGQWVDMEIVRGYGGLPYIPGTALMGVVRHDYDQSYGLSGQEAEYFFGRGDSEAPEGTQSHFVLEDALPLPDSKPQVVVRDGIQIDGKTGTAAAGAKYAYEILERGCRFGLRGELTVYSWEGRPAIDPDDAFVSRILAILHRGIRVGAKTRVGLGRLRSENLALYRFDFPEDGGKWLHSLDEGVGGLTPYTLPFTSLPAFDGLRVEAEFHLGRSLMIGSPGLKPEGPDKVHIRSQEESVIPGTALKGALRHQTERIIHTLRQPDGGMGEGDDVVCQSFCQDLFGHVPDREDGAKISARASRLRVDEVVLSGESRSEQTRIRIDRFTGGVQSGALFDEQPIYHHQETVRLILTVAQAQHREVGLILLLLKDLWTGHLPLGGEIGIGRGLLVGQYAQLDYCRDGEEKRIVMDQRGEELHFSNRKWAESCVQEFIEDMTRNEPGAGKP